MLMLLLRLALSDCDQRGVLLLTQNMSELQAQPTPDIPGQRLGVKTSRQYNVGILINIQTVPSNSSYHETVSLLAVLQH